MTISGSGFEIVRASGSYTATISAAEFNTRTANGSRGLDLKLDRLNMVSFDADISFDSAGNIAGSKLTLNRACLNMMRHTGAGICEVFRFASANPARAAGLEGRGEIHKGAAADLILTDHMFNIQKVFLDGIRVK